MEHKSLFWKSATYAWCAYFALFPFVSVKTFLYGGTSFRSVTYISLVSILALLYAIWLWKKGSALVLPRSPIMYALAAYIAVMFVAGIVGFDFGTSFWSKLTRTTGIWYFLHLGFAMFMLWQAASFRPYRNLLMLSIIIPAALFSLASFFGPQGLGWLFKSVVNDGFTFWNSSFAGMYLFGAFLISIYYLWSAEIRKWLMYVLPLALLVNPFLIGKDIWFGNFDGVLAGEARASSYAALLSVILLVLMWLVLRIQAKKIQEYVVYGGFGLFVVGVGLFASSLFSDNGFVREFYLSRSTAARPIVWEIAEGAIAERPLFGWGGDNFEQVFQLRYDNRLLQDEYGAEPWFDRAHNVFIDQATDNGVVGLIFYFLVYFVLLLCLARVFLASSDKGDRVAAGILSIYFVLHLLELQTAFDTSISYPILVFMVVWAVLLYGKNRKDQGKASELTIHTPYVRYAVAGIIALSVLASVGWGLIPFVKSQSTNGYIRTVGSAEKRIPLYPKLFGSRIDTHAILWRTTTDFQRGIGENPKVLQDPKRVEDLKRELALFVEAYAKYVREHPNDLRANLNYADVLIYSNLFGVNRLEEAQVVLDHAIELVPQAPQSYWMKAVAYIYMGKFGPAREFANKGLEINPEIKESKKVVEYVEKSIKSFPEVDLFFFRLI